MFIRWIVIYPVDSAIHRLNNWGQICSTLHRYNRFLNLRRFQMTSTKIKIIIPTNYNRGKQHDEVTKIQRAGIQRAGNSPVEGAMVLALFLIG